MKRRIIFAQVKKNYLDADDESIRKLLGIKWPGVIR